MFVVSVLLSRVVSGTSCCFVKKEHSKPFRNNPKQSQILEKSTSTPPKIDPKTSQNRAQDAPKSRSGGDSAGNRFSIPNRAPNFPLLEASWGVLGASWGRLGALLGRLGPPWGVLGTSWGRLGTSWEHLGSVLGRLAYRRGNPPEKYRFYFRKVNPETLKIIDFSLVFQGFFDFRRFQHKYGF